MSLTKQEKRILRDAVARLRGTNAATEVREALTGPARSFLETWVIPSLEILARDDRSRHDMRLAEDLVRLPLKSRAPDAEQ